ncbi:SPO22-domain-containing protein [Westerdykella ornata]|uniref:Protein ZIP4 homolog n=1 Tax=Westerdykella ornata TaxID=318751 RepID=A0A6A6JZG5_WESOR|nr:SPO22-domain-containing protein [Westerdykella ornata]KAF2281473.1 SPO22-domain-containing protein [Westerdykella ornata]
MAPNLSAKAEREKRLKSLLAFASSLSARVNAPHNSTLLNDLQDQIRSLPLAASTPVATKQDELDKLGTDLWNLSISLRRRDSQPIEKEQKDASQRQKTWSLLRVFAFLLLDTAAGQATKARERKHCIRLLRVALKSARGCIDSGDLPNATRVLERAADYQEALGGDGDEGGEEGGHSTASLRAEYFIMRMALAWRQKRMDTAEHMFLKSKQLNSSINSSASESLAELLYEIGRSLLEGRSYELAIKWLERAYDTIGEQDPDNFSPDAGELRLGIMQSIIQANMKLNTKDALAKAWDIVQLLDTEYGDKMAVQLLKLELLSIADPIDSDQVYGVLLRMIRSVVLNETNFRTIMHHIHRLKEHSNVTACRALDDLVNIRLFREENEGWLEKAIITYIWAGTTGSVSENVLESLEELFETVSRNTKHPLSAPATHASQTLLWRKVEAAYSQCQFAVAESWCRLCLRPLFEKAGELNRSKIFRKIILCAFSCKNYAGACEAFSQMSDTGKDEPITRYLMYKVALQRGDADLAASCLETICKKSSKDVTLLYACVLEALNSGDKRQTINALERVLDRYDYSAPAGVHLPAVLRCTARALTSELVKDGKLCDSVMEEVCKVFEGGCAQAKASLRRPTTPAHELFTASEFEWFSKNSYNLALKYCAEMQPGHLVRLLSTCAEFIKLLKDTGNPDPDLPLRLMFCDFLSCCAYTTLARAEDNVKDSLLYYVQVRKHSKAFRRAADEELAANRLSKSAQADVSTKHFQVLKLELEAVLKLADWEALDALFEECWKHENAEPLETLADLVLVIHSFLVNANVDAKYQERALKALAKIITLVWRRSDSDIVKISRWIRCLFQLALTFDDAISLRCLEQATSIAAVRHGVRSLTPYFDEQISHMPIQQLHTPPVSSSPVKIADEIVKEPNHYPETELEWLATTSWNHAVDYYAQENGEKYRMWAERAINLAEWAEDGGGLAALLMKKKSELAWEE